MINAMSQEEGFEEFSFHPRQKKKKKEALCATSLLECKGDLDVFPSLQGLSFRTLKIQ